MAIFVHAGKVNKITVTFIFQKERRLRRHLDELALTQRGKKQLETLLLGGQTQEELEDVARHIIVPRRGAKADLNIFDLP